METIQKRLIEQLIDLDLELYILLQSDQAVGHYLQELITDHPFPLQVLTAAIYPSRFSYLKDLLEREFLNAFLQLASAGILNYELLNLCVVCSPVFNAFEFPVIEESRWMESALVGLISEYLEGGCSDAF